MSKLIKVDELQYKQEFLDNLFENRTIYAPKGRKFKYNMYVKNQIFIKEERLQKEMMRRARIFSNVQGFDLDDFINGICEMISHYTLCRFACEDGESFEGITNGTDKENYDKLISYLRINAIQNQAFEIANENNSTRYTPSRREIERLDMLSLNKVISGEDGHTTLGDMVTSDNMLVQDDVMYKQSDFAEFFEKCLKQEIKRGTGKTPLLTSERVEKFKELATNFGADMSINETGKQLGLQNGEANQFLERLSNTVEVAWANHKKEKTNPELDLWNRLYDVLIRCEVDRDTDDFYVVVCEWVHSNLGNEIVSNLAMDNLTGSECRAFLSRGNAAEIGKKLYDLIVKRLDYLQIPKVEKVKFYKKENEKFDRTRINKYEEFMATCQEPCKVYRDGVLVAYIDTVPMPKAKTVVVNAFADRITK